MGLEIVLASGSATRKSMLRAAGVPITVDAADIDEGEIKRAVQRQGGTATEAVGVLAEAKARYGAVRHPDALVIGADQLLVCDGRWFDKPVNVAEARDHLCWLRGRTHELVTGSVVVCGDAMMWQATTTARLTMRSFSDAFLDIYLSQQGDVVTTTVGAYQIEGAGIALFERVEGDHFDILGLPLLPLLAFLRDCGGILA